MNENNISNPRCGAVAIVGRTNVGKSVLFNRLMQTHLSAVTRKPQTTRFNIRGILTESDTQIIFIDTPGLNRKLHRPLNKILNMNAQHAIAEEELIIMVVVQQIWTNEDESVLKQIQATQKPCFLVVNKCDLLKKKEQMLPWLEQVQYKYPFIDIFPLSALKDSSFENLKLGISRQLPYREFLFDKEQLTDKNERFLVAEMIREQAMIELHQELPYTVHIEIEKFEVQANCTHIDAVFHVDKENQRPIVIGSKGEKLKRIGSKARIRIEELLGRKIFLQLWVKKRKTSWQKDMNLLNSYLDI